MSGDPLYGLPLEYRPVTDPAAARAAALQSMNATMATRQTRSRSAPKTRPVRRTALSPSALRYALAEERWQRVLRRRRRSGRADLDLAKARRAALPRLRRDDSTQGGTMAVGAAGGASTDAYTDGSHPTPLGVYTQEEVDRLGRAGKALWIGGRFAWPIANRRDLLNCVAGWRLLRPGKAASEVKAWIKRRAIGMNLEGCMPSSWQPSVPKPIDGSGE
jgi:hypothetical protein